MIIRVLLIDSDKDFRKRFSEYLVANCEDITLTSAEGGAGNINIIKSMFFENDIVIADERAWTPEFIPKGYTGRRVVLTVEREGSFSEQADKDINNILVYKFQSMPDILKCIPEFTLGTGRKAGGRDSDLRMEVVAVSGFFGGCGKTSFSVMLARLNQSKFKKRTLIISLENMSDINDYFTQAGGEFCGEDPEVQKAEDINMLLLSFLSGTSVNMKDFIVKDRFGVATFILPRGLMSDIADLGEEHIGGFIDHIERSGLFDTVIFDMDNRLSAGNGAVYKRVDRVFILCREDRFRTFSEVVWEENVIAHCKDRRFIRTLNFCGGVRRVKSVIAEDEAYTKRESDFRLPFDPDSFFVREGGVDISMVGEYAAAAGYLLDEVMTL